MADTPGGLLREMACQAFGAQAALLDSLADACDAIDAQQRCLVCGAAIAGDDGLASLDVTSGCRCRICPACLERSRRS